MKPLCTLVLVALCACTAPVSHPLTSTHSPVRVVSLVPSLTEDICAIGAGGALVGVSQFTSDVACARGIPQVNNFASLDAEKIIRLRPDLIVGIPAQSAMSAPLRRAGFRTVLMRDDEFDDIFADIAELGTLLGRSAQAQRLVAALSNRTATLVRGAHFAHRPTVFFVAQAMPLWTVGPHSYIGSLITRAGGKLATSSLGLPYAQFSGEALLRSDPDVIVATSDARLEGVLGTQPWRSLRAVARHHVYILQNGALLVRPGPRYNEGLSWLIDCLRRAAT